MTKQATNTRDLFRAMGEASSQGMADAGGNSPGEPEDLAPARVGILSSQAGAATEMHNGRRVKRIIKRVNPARCRIRPDHDRRYALLDDASCEDLIDGFRSKGGQEIPAIVRPIADDSRYDYEIIVGSRRHWTAKHLNMDLLVEERTMTDEEAFVLTDKENRQRKDISDYERGVHYLNALREHYGGVQSRMAQVLNMKEDALSRFLMVGRLDEAIVDAVEDIRQITRNQVRDLAAAIERGGRTPAALKDEAWRAVVNQAKELQSEKPKALALFKQLTKTASAITGGPRSATPKLLGHRDAKRTGRRAVDIARKGKTGLQIQIHGGSGATRDEVISAAQELIAEHYKPPVDRED